MLYKEFLFLQTRAALHNTLLFSYKSEIFTLCQEKEKDIWKVKAFLTSFEEAKLAPRDLLHILQCKVKYKLNGSTIEKSGDSVFLVRYVKSLKGYKETASFFSDFYEEFFTWKDIFNS